MTILTAGHAAQAAHHAISTYREQEEELTRTWNEVQQDLATLQGQLRTALGDLAHAFLPDAGEETVARATEATGHSRLADVLGELQRAHEQRIARRQAIEGMPEHRDRELLLDPATGTLALQVAEADENLRAASPKVARFEAVSGFAGLRARHGQPPQSPAARLIGRILLYGFVVEWLRSRAERSLLEAFPGSTVDQLVAEYDEARQTKEFWEGEVKRHRAERQRVEDLVREHETLGREIAAHDENALHALRGELAAYLANCHAFTEIRPRAAGAARVGVATVIALKQKAEYLERMAAYLGREIADRQQQQNKLRAVSQKWQRNPGKRLSGDKTGWLVTGPARKAESTRRQVTRVKKVKHAIVDFDDYDVYDHLLEDGGNVLAWDVFARMADERMPGDAFVREVIPGVGEHRDEHGAPDYGAIDDASSSVSASTVAGIAATTVAISALASSDLVAEGMDGEWTGGDSAEEGGDGAGMEDAS